MSAHEYRGIDVEVEVEPKPLALARYVRAPNGHLLDCGQLPPLNQHPSIELAGLADIRLPVTYDSDTARTAAAHLLGYAHQLHTQEPLSTRVSVTLLEPDSRSASISTWNLIPGLALNYDAPFGSSLDADIDTWALTSALATRWARALLTLAAELDHASAVAAHGVLADRAGTTPTENIRGWLRRMTDDATTDDRSFPTALRDLLDEEDTIIRDGTLIAALDIANPDLPTSLAGLRLRSAETLTHRDAAAAIKQLATQYGIPLYLWTAESWYLATHVGEPPLTEQEWLRFSRTAELCNFPLLIEQLQRDRNGLDFQLALVQAGVLCRQCCRRITGAIADTFGHCSDCLPSDRDAALTVALERGCPVDPFDEGIASHTGNPGELCSICSLPLPEAE